MFEAVPQNIYKPVTLTSRIERRTKFFHRVGRVEVFKAHPFTRLGLANKVNQRGDIQTLRGVVSVGAFDVTTCGRQKCRLDVRLKAAFGQVVVHCATSFLPVTYSNISDFFKRSSSATS